MTLNMLTTVLNKLTQQRLRRWEFQDGMQMVQWFSFKKLYYFLT
jgi:hypothetical protein